MRVGETFEEFEARMTRLFAHWAGRRKNPGGMPWGWWGRSDSSYVQLLVSTGRWEVIEIPPRNIHGFGVPAQTATTHVLFKVDK